MLRTLMALALAATLLPAAESVWSLKNLASAPWTLRIDQMKSVKVGARREQALIEGGFDDRVVGIDSSSRRLSIKGDQYTSLPPL
jgi:hypothetical protein